MKKIVYVVMSLILVFGLCACSSGNQTTHASQPLSNAPAEQNDNASVGQTDEPDEGRGDIIDEQVPDGADTIRQGVYYYELAELSGDYGDGLSPREGAELTDELLADIGLYSDNGGIPADKCVYISLDELAILDSVMGRECYIYSVGIGTPEGGLMGDDYQVVYRISVDYSGEKTAAIYDDFSDGNDGRGDLIPDDE